MAHPHFRLSGIAAAAALLAGCTMIPNYERPASPVAPKFDDAAAADAASATPAANLGWREFFPDAHLQQLIELSLRNNRDLRVAAINVETAQAQYRIQRAALLPTINGTASEQVNKFPAGVFGAGAGGSGGAGGGQIGTGSVNRFYNVGVGITSYEVDLFGRVRSLGQAQLATYLGLEQTRISTQISLVAQVASAYFTLLADQQLLAVTQSTLDSQKNSLDLSQKRLDAGATDALTVRQVETSVYSAQANLARYSRQVQMDRNLLAQLVGVAELPQDLPTQGGLDENTLTVKLAPGLPSDLLVRRPDILAAEQQLLSANANIGAARAAFFPRITLTGSYGTASTELNGLFDKGSSAWTFAPSLSVPIFAGGANLASLDAAKLQKDARIAQYEGAIQVAFREVSDALASRASLDDELVAQNKLVAAATDSLKLSTLRFDRGVDNYLTVLDSQRSQYTAQQALETLKLSRVQNLVTLYKALGGGWSDRTVPPDATASDARP